MPRRTVGQLTRVTVVAAALLDERGRVLIAQRPVGKPLAGHWEFPGGKMAAGETQAEALRRELSEELGITLLAHRHVMTVEHDYPDRNVTLHFHIADAYSGVARGLDNQALRWVQIDELGQQGILDADQPFVTALQTQQYSATSRPGSGTLGAEHTMAAAAEVMEFSGEKLAVRNPRSGEVDYQITAPSLTEVRATAQRLRHAQLHWRNAGQAYRIEILRRWREQLALLQNELIAALATDTGRYAISASECTSLLATIERWCVLAPTLAREEEGRSVGNPALTYRSQYVPYALVGVISPWNFPLVLTFIDAIPALLAGCSVLIKPSEVTPRFCAPIIASIEAVPELAAVLCVAPGGRETGEALVGVVDAVCFTGSVRTGRMVAENAARMFIPAFLELGGNDPLIITASANIERAADIALRSSCLATGQACQSIEHIYVDKKIYEEFVALLVAKAKRVEPNWPDIHSGTIGPFIFGKQADIVIAQLADAVAKGARVLTGGKIENHGGKWLRPTVVVDVNHDMAIMRDETFGPVMPVMPYDSIEQALGLANDGAYGLSAGVVAGSLDEAEVIGRQIDAGGISLNDGSLTAVMHEAEKHSFKMSGMGGSRMGPSGYTRFFRRKVLIRQTGAPVTMDMISEVAARPR